MSAVSQQLVGSTPSTDHRDVPTVEIRPSGHWVPLNLRELWAYRELLFFLAWRDVKVRYKQTGLGVAWAVLQPLFTMLLFSVVFGRLAKIPSDGVPYPLFVFCALLPWQLFAFALNEASSSVVTNERLITKVYFPRLIVPASALLAGLVDFSISFIILMGMMAYFHVRPAMTIVLVPALVLMAIVTALAVGIWLAAFNVRYRDVRYTLTFLTQFWMYATPVAYPSSLVPHKWRWVIGLNPMAGIVEGFRWALLGPAHAAAPVLLVSSAISVVILVGGLYYFRAMERTFADVI